MLRRMQDRAILTWAVAAIAWGLLFIRWGIGE